MPVHQERKLELRPYAVGSADEDGLLHSGKLGSEQSPEAADARNTSGSCRPQDMLFHQLHRAVACSDVHACLFVAFASAALVHISPPCLNLSSSNIYFPICVWAVRRDILR